MEKLSKYVLADIICNIGPWPEVIRMSLVCKKWKALILDYHHNFTLQGSKRPLLIPSNVKIEEALFHFKSLLKLNSLDLRNVNVSVDFLSEILLNQPGLKILDLTNVQTSVGQIWSYLKASKPKEITFYLEELRITNNCTVYLGYDALVSIYPNLVNLYVGNTSTNLDNLIQLITKLPKLQILDVSLCKIDSDDMSHIDFRELLQYSALEKLFISKINDTVLETLLSCEVEVIEKTIGDVLLEINSEHFLYSLEEWVELGGDVNLMCSPNHELCKYLGVYPQIKAIASQNEDSLLRETFKILINYGLDLSFHSSEIGTGGNLLNAAIINGKTGLAHLLVSCGSDLSPCFQLIENEEPSMTLASRLGDFSVIQIFLDFNLFNTDYYSPVFCNPICTAASNGNVDLFIFLIEQGVPLFHCSKHENILISNTKILEMALSPEYKEVFAFPCEMLYEAAQFYILNNQEDQAFLIINHLEENTKDKEQEILREKSAEIKEKLAQEKTRKKKGVSDFHKPLIVIATEKRLMNVLKVLIEKGFDINAEDMHGWTALICACSYGYTDFIPYLCENGAVVNKRDKWWKTALHQAAQNGHTDTVTQLIRYGAALSPECEKGFTPLYYAILNNRKDVTQILKAQGAKCSKVPKKICSVF